jgi:hypothetical protein
MPAAPSSGAAPAAASQALVPSRRPGIDQSQLSHTVPRRLRQGRVTHVEVRIDRPPITGGAPSQWPQSLRSEMIVARAIAVRLRPLAGRYLIEAASPETVWDQGGGPGAGRLESEAAVWRFAVTPLAAGKGALQLAVSARTLGADGVLVETQLPDVGLEVRASPDLGGLARRAGLLVLAVVIGMVAIKAAEFAVSFDAAHLVAQLFRR